MLGRGDREIGIIGEGGYRLMRVLIDGIVSLVGVGIERMIEIFFR